MNLKQFFQILAVVVLSSLLYEFLFQVLRNYLINDNMGTSLFSLFFALACVLIFVYFKKDFTLNEILKYFFLSSILRVIFGPYFMFLKVKLNLAFI
ncbi:hypothetical protein ASG01_06755 [Chryseobacterium sp. Leaf180]|nr:hypothetical protein ASG01_06755 [Chryseobacterium sp. Leaf180]